MRTIKKSHTFTINEVNYAYKQKIEMTYLIQKITNCFLP